MKPMLEIQEEDEFYFDAAAADRPVRFIEKYLRHWEGRFAGRPFTLLPWQRDVTQALFGWKRRADGLRRFRELYLLTAKGSGKTPLLSAWAMYMLLGDDEPGAHVISCATDFQQAFLAIDGGRKFVAADRTLSKLCDPKQFEIRVPRTNSKWTVMSGTAEGRHGFRPHCVTYDELHEAKSSLLYDNLTANMTKRRQPLILTATNAGASRASFAWKLHERALAVLKGKPGASKTLLPVIYETPESMQWDTEEAARAANPSLGDVLSFDQLATELEKARESPDAEHRYRRLYLSQWQRTGAGRWLDMDQFDAVTAPFDPGATLAGQPLYVGLDLAEVDDLCAAAFVWPTPDRLYVASHFWMPRTTAERYVAQEGVPYDEWEEAGALTLLDEPTVGPASRRLIAAHVIAMSREFAVKAICYDPYKADETIAVLEGAGLTCTAVRQGYSVSPGCAELERRIKDGSAVIAPNAVLRFCATNAETKSDDRGNYWVVKPGAKGKFAGRRGSKVDGVSALVTACTESRRHAFPAAKKEWRGNGICLI